MDDPIFRPGSSSDETIYRAPASLAEGMGIRATARVFQVKKDTVLLWLRRAGNHSAQVSAYLSKGLTFSKKREYLEWHLHLAIAYYHFVLPHRGVRRRLPEPLPTKGNGSYKKWEHRTPAMSAYLTDHIGRKPYLHGPSNHIWEP